MRTDNSQTEKETDRNAIIMTLDLKRGHVNLKNPRGNKFCKVCTVRESNLVLRESSTLSLGNNVINAS